MVSIAREAIADNKLSGTITVVPKRSTDMAVGLGLDMPQRADVVVSEILDTELIGEGVLGTMRHMHEHLAAPGATIIPGAATVHVQLFESEYLRGWHDPDHGGSSAARGGVVLGLGECGGPASPHDVQANRFSSNVRSLSNRCFGVLLLLWGTFCCIYGPSVVTNTNALFQHSSPYLENNQKKYPIAFGLR